MDQFPVVNRAVYRMQRGKRVAHLMMHSGWVMTIYDLLRSTPLGKVEMEHVKCMKKNKRM